jgi:hypothetical protein
MDKAIRTAGNSTLIDVEVVTNSATKGISGYNEWRNRIVLKINEKPLQNRANRAIIKFISTKLGITQKDVKIVAGRKSNLKTIKIDLDVSIVKQFLENERI